MNIFQRTINNELHELESLMYAISNFMEDRGVDPQPVYRINLAVEEMITNTIKFGYNDYDSHQINVQLEVNEEEIVCVIDDDGREFNPLETKETAVPDDLQDRKIGGLGIALVKKLLDSVTYRREGRRNILEIKARRNPPPEAT